jgi:hypothetical protein
MNILKQVKNMDKNNLLTYLFMICFIGSTLVPSVLMMNATVILSDIEYNEEEGYWFIEEHHPTPAEATQWMLIGMIPCAILFLMIDKEASWDKTETRGD